MEARAAYGSFSERPRLTVVRDEGGGYSALPHEIMRDTRLSRDARLLYAILQGHWWQGGECWASHATLAAEMGCKERMLRYYLTELVAAGVVTERRRGHGQAKAYAPAQAARDCQLNRQEGAASGPNRQEIASQAATAYGFNRQGIADRSKSTEEDSLKEEDKERTAASAAPTPTAAKTKPESRARRLMDDAALTDAHRDAAERAGFDAARCSAEWDKFADYHRAKGSRMVDWLAAWRTWLRNAVLFDAKRAPTSQRNGSDRIPPASAARQTSSWVGRKNRGGGELLRAEHGQRS